MATGQTRPPRHAAFLLLRDRAKAAVGERFDFRRLHMVLLDADDVPRDVVEMQVIDSRSVPPATMQMQARMPNRSGPSEKGYFMMALR